MVPLDVGLVEALGLHLETREGSVRDGFDHTADAELAMDRAGDTLGDVRGRLDSAPKLVHLADPCQRDAVLAHLVEPTKDRLDRAREHVHTAHRDHVGHAAGDAAGKLHQSAPAGAGTPQGSHAVPRAVVDYGHIPTYQISEDVLSKS